MNNTLIRLDKTYRMNELPKLKSNAFIWNNVMGYTGSLIKRPVKASLGIYKHYGFIYGFDTKDTLWIIENNINGVECVTYRDFLQGNTFTTYFIEHNFNQNTCNEILMRAIEKGFDKYHERYNNCEHFINYCLYGEHKSMQAEFTEIIANTAISALEIRINLSPKISDHNIIDNLNKTREGLGLKRSKEMQKLFDERRQYLESVERNKKKKAV